MVEENKSEKSNGAVSKSVDCPTPNDTQSTAPSKYSCTSPTSIDSRHVSDEMTTATSVPVAALTCQQKSPMVASISETSSCSRTRSRSRSQTRSRSRLQARSRPVPTPPQVCPCARCIELTRAFLESMHKENAPPFAMPQWVNDHQSFTAVVETTQTETTKRLVVTASDALIYAVCGCFTPIDTICRACCDYPLIRTMLSQPDVAPMHRRTRNLVTELVLHASAFYEGLMLRESCGGAVLLDHIYEVLWSFLNRQLAGQFCTGIEAAGQNEVTVRLEERHETILCFQILINLSRQSRNQRLLCAHEGLMRTSVAITSHPLLDEHMLSLSLLYVSFLGEGFLQAPSGHLVDSIISVLEMYTDGMPSSLVCPMYLPERPDKQLLASLCRIAATFARSEGCAPRTHGPTPAHSSTRRLLDVTVTALRNETATWFDMADMADIALILASRHPEFVVSNAQFVPAIVAMLQHVWAGQSARQTLRHLQCALPSLQVSDDVTQLLEETKLLDSDVNMHHIS